MKSSLRLGIEELDDGGVRRPNVEVNEAERMYVVRKNATLSQIGESARGCSSSNGDTTRKTGPTKYIVLL
jgi:hypothetical protein